MIRVGWGKTRCLKASSGLEICINIGDLKIINIFPYGTSGFFLGGEPILMHSIVKTIQTKINSHSKGHADKR